MTVQPAPSLPKIRAKLRTLCSDAADFIEACGQAWPRPVAVGSANRRFEHFSELLADFDRHCNLFLVTQRPRGSLLRLVIRMSVTGRELRHITDLCLETTRSTGGSDGLEDADVAAESAKPLAQATHRAASLLRNAVTASLSDDDGNVELARLQFNALVALLEQARALVRTVAQQNPSTCGACLRVIHFSEQIQRTGEIALRISGFSSRYELLPIVALDMSRGRRRDHARDKSASVSKAGS